MSPGTTEQKRLRRWIAVDLVMMGLLVLNLMLLIFDTIFRSEWVRGGLAAHLPAFHDLYATHVHRNFVAIDLGFVAVYLVELGVRWIASARRRIYGSWYAYPLIHWYDVLGCVPIGSLRFFRVLRAVAIVVRLQRLGLIDLRRTWIYRVYDRYRSILAEEISDRVVVRVLEGVQEEIGEGSPVMERLWREVVVPRKDLVLQVSAAQLEQTVKEVVAEQRVPIRRYVDGLLAEALDRDRLMPTLESMPMVGRPLVREIDRTIRRVVDSVVERILDEAERVDADTLLDQIQRGLARRPALKDEELAATIRQMTMESLEIIKDQVRVQQWKLKKAEASPVG